MKSNNQYHEEFLKERAQNKLKIHLQKMRYLFSNTIRTISSNKNSLSNDLKEFGVDTNEPDFLTLKVKILVRKFQNPESDQDRMKMMILEIPAFFEKTKKLMVFKKINESHHGNGYKKTLSGAARRIN